MIPPDYVRIAHRRSALMELQRVLQDRYIVGDTPAKEQIICEEVPFAHKEVSNEALLEVLEMLLDLEKNETNSLSQFELRRKDVKPAQQPPPAAEEVHEDKQEPVDDKPAGRKSKSAAASAGKSD